MKANVTCRVVTIQQKPPLKPPYVKWSRFAGAEGQGDTMTRKIPYWRVTLSWEIKETGEIKSIYKWVFAYTPSDAVVRSLQKWGNPYDTLPAEIRQNLYDVAVERA